MYNAYLGPFQVPMVSFLLAHKKRAKAWVRQLDHVWFNRFANSGIVSETEKVMTKVIFQCYLQIDRGVRFKNEDPLDKNAKLTNCKK